MAHDRRYVIAQDPANPHPLGRHVNHDPRSASHPFAARPEAAAVPVSRDRWPRRVPVLDQDLDVTFRGVTYHGLGSCVGNAFTYWLGTDNTDRPGFTSLSRALTGALDPALAEVPSGPLDELWAVGLYSECTANDPYTGTFPPDDTGSDGVTAGEVLRRWGLVGFYSHTFGGLPDLLTALQTTPVPIGVSWYDSMFYPDSRGFVSISPNAHVAGGHEIEANGALSIEERWVEFDNSWGAGWGVDGRCRMTFDTVARLLAEDGDGTVPHAVVTAPVDPIPVPQPDPGSTPVPVQPEGCLPAGLRALGLTKLADRLTRGR